MPGTPGTLSEVSPASASTSPTSSGPTPKRAITSARSIAFCFIGSYICTPARDQLHQVLVGRDDDHLAALGPGRAGVGRDQVVGLVVLDLDHRQAERARGLAHHRELRHEVVRRLQSGWPCSPGRSPRGSSPCPCRRPPPAGRPACPGPGGTACCRSRRPRRPARPWGRSRAAGRRTPGRCSPTRRSGRGGWSAVRASTARSLWAARKIGECRGRGQTANRRPDSGAAHQRRRRPRRASL